MKYLLILLFLFSFSSAWALPECEGSPYTGDDLSKIKHWDNCRGIITFSNGEEYVGEFKDGHPNGQGTFTWADGMKYVGEFKGGKKITLSEALSQTEQESYETVKNFSSTDARAGFASLQDGFNTSQQSMGFEGHNGQVVPTEKVDASVTKAMTRDYSDLVKRFKK